jgi:hypothetical protein
VDDDDDDFVSPLRQTSRLLVDHQIDAEPQLHAIGQEADFQSRAVIHARAGSMSMSHAPNLAQPGSAA